MRRRRRALLVLFVVIAVAMLGLYVAARRMLGGDILRMQLEQQLSALFDQPVHIRSAAASVLPHVALNLQDVSIGAPPALHFSRVRLRTGLRPLLSRTIDDAEIELADGYVHLPLPFSIASGSSPSNAAAGGVIVQSIRSIDIRSVALVSGTETLTIDADCAIAGDRLAIQRLSARGKATRLEARGALTSIARRDGDLAARADPLDLDELFAFVSAWASTSRTSAAGRTPAETASSFRVKIDLTAPSGRFATQSFQALSTTLRLTPGEWTLAPLAVRTFGGSFEGEIAADTRRKVPELHLTGRADRLNLVEMMNAAGSQGGITGRVTGTVSLSGAGTSSDALIRTANGTIKAVVSDGSIPHLDLVRTIVLTFGKPSGTPPEGSGSAFSRLGGTFAVAHGTVRSDNFSMTARDFEMSGDGTLHLVSGDVQARAQVVLSEELTLQAGTDLRRYAQEDGRVVIPTTITGTLQQPRVFVDVTAATKRALANELRRRARSVLGDLLRKKKRDPRN